MSKLIHAFRRTASIEVELFDQKVIFAPDHKGRIVAEVDDPAVAARLLQIKDAYRVLKDLEAEAAAQAQAEAEAAAAAEAEAKAKAEEEAKAAAAAKAQQEADAEKPAAGRKKGA